MCELTGLNIVLIVTASSPVVIIIRLISFNLYSRCIVFQVCWVSQKVCEIKFVASVRAGGGDSLQNLFEALLQGVGL